MYQRRRILQIWEQTGLKNSRSKQVRDFIEFVEKTPSIGWRGYAIKLRKDYPRVLGNIITPLLECDDPLITTNVLRTVDLKKKNEREIVIKFAQKADIAKYSFALSLLAQTGTESIKKELEKRKDLPPTVKQLLIERRSLAQSSGSVIEAVPGTRASKE